MSELIINASEQSRLRRSLLAGVSAIAVTGCTSLLSTAQADDTARPMLWIELDGQYSRMQASDPRFVPAFLPLSPFDGISHLNLEDGPRISWDKGAKLTLQPHGSDWFLVLGARYGKTSRSAFRDVHPTTSGLTKYSTKHYNAYQNLTSHSSESHVILDFQVGKDVGIGRFGSNGTSVIDAGIRIAQFRAKSHAEIKSQPTNIGTYYTTINKFSGSFDASRRFNGIGPSLSWEASANLWGNPRGGNITFDWGINGALLFGRQKSTASRSTAQNQYHYLHGALVYRSSNASVRSKAVAVPNIGGFAGVSWRYPNAKVSFGYRADFFFGAMDSGLDSRRTTDIGFHGPFASLSIGLGQ